MFTYSSKLLEEAVNELSKLPGIGRKTAFRLALHLLKEDEKAVEHFGNAIIKMRSQIKYCKVCHNISDDDTCFICNNPGRDKSTICVVEEIRDVMIIENTGQYHGTYHILGGIISPVDGISPHDLNINTLNQRVSGNNIAEVILALPTTMEGDTTNFYIYKRLKDSGVKITTIARGIAIGDGLEYTDEVTLARSIITRTLYESTMTK